MTRVEQGIEINARHLFNVMHDITEEVSFRDQILALGYEDIEDFFKEKTIFEMQKNLKNGKLYTVKMPNLVNILNILVQKKQNGIVSIYTDTTCVCHGQNTQKQLNTDYCEKNNIPIYPYNSFGGNIVATAEDYGMVFLIPSEINMSESFVLEKVARILTKYFNNVNIEGNDILINNKKVIGSGSLIVNDMFLMLFYFSMEDKGDLIVNICGEPTSGKAPGHIDSQILPLETLKEELLSWLQGL